jgi:hypothetical protein
LFKYTRLNPGLSAGRHLSSSSCMLFFLIINLVQFPLVYPHSLCSYMKKVTLIWGKYTSKHS